MTRRDPSELMLRLALALCAGCGWLASSIVLLEHLDPPETWPLATVCLAWLIFSPLYESDLARVFQRVPGIGRGLARLVWVLQVLPIFLLPVPITDALIFGSMILAQGHLFLASDEDKNAARCLAAAPLLSVIALAYAPSLPVLLLVPISACLSVLAIVMLSGRVARHRVKRGPGTAESASAVRARAVYAVPLAVLSSGLAAVIFLLTAQLLSGSESETRLAPTTPSPLEPPQDASTLGGTGQGNGGDPGYSPDLPFSGGTLPFSDDPVMIVRPLDDTTANATGGIVHMRDMVLDHFYEGGIRTLKTLPPEFTDEDDGVADGWSWVLDRADAEPTLRYDVLARRLDVPEAGLTLVFAPHPLAAIELASVRYGPDQILATREEVEEWFGYELRVLDRDLSNRKLRRATASHPDAQYLQLPPASPALDALRVTAAELVKDADTDYDRVHSVNRFLLTEFTYDLSSLEFEGTDALARFLDERRGYCTHFASAATLMLRSQGIAARVATGFSGHEWSAEDEGWLIRERDAHAWVEVHFERLGWVTFDPTPAAGRDPATNDYDPYAEDEPSWYERLSKQFEEWIESAGENGSLGAIFSTLLLGPWELLSRHPGLWAVPSALALLFIHWLRTRRRAGTRWDEDLAGITRPTFALFQRLAQALAELEHRRAPSQTPREFADAVCATGGASFAPLTSVTEIYYRERFGGRPLEPREASEIEAFIRTLRELRKTGATNENGG